MQFNYKIISFLFYSDTDSGSSSASEPDGANISVPAKVNVYALLPCLLGLLYLLLIFPFSFGLMISSAASTVWIHY